MKRIVLLLLACFPSVFMLAQVPETYWIPDNVGQFNITLFAQLSLAGDVPNSQESPVANYELGVFDQDGKCCGVAFPPTWKNVRQRWVYSLAIQGETGSTYTFKIYDHATGQELPMACSENGDHYMFSVVEDPFSPYYGDGQTYGQLSGLTPGPDMLHFMLVQTIALSAGWNWVSSYLEITMADLKAAILAAVPSTDRPIIKSQRNGQTRWSGVIWSGGLKALDLSQMYEIQVGSDCEITLQGEPINPAEHPATIKPDNNWIAFPLSETMSVVNAFAANGAWAPTNGDIVKSRKDGQAKRTGAAWPGGLKNLVPGQGYIYNSKATTDKTLTFPTSSAK